MHGHNTSAEKTRLNTSSPAQQDAAAGLPDRLDERPEARDLIGREAGGWFVEEQESGAQHECAGDFHEAELAVLQPVRALVRERLEANDS